MPAAAPHNTELLRVMVFWTINGLAVLLSLLALIWGIVMVQVYRRDGRRHREGLCLRCGVRPAARHGSLPRVWRAGPHRPAGQVSAPVKRPRRRKMLTMPLPSPTDVVTAITGASGARYAQRFVEGLVTAGVRCHLVVSPLGRRLLHDELGMDGLDVPMLAGGGDPGRVTVHNYNDVGAVLASGSFLHDGMVIVPCSSNTLAEVAHGLGDNLVSRAAAVTLKERRRLVVCHREMPLSPVDVNNYKLLTDAGGILAPANPGFYLNPGDDGRGWSTSWRASYWTWSASGTRWTPAGTPSRCGHRRCGGRSCEDPARWPG